MKGLLLLSDFKEFVVLMRKETKLPAEGYIYDEQTDTLIGNWLYKDGKGKLISSLKLAPREDEIREYLTRKGIFKHPKLGSFQSYRLIEELVKSYILFGNVFNLAYLDFDGVVRENDSPFADSIVFRFPANATIEEMVAFIGDHSERINKMKSKILGADAKKRINTKDTDIERDVYIYNYYAKLTNNKERRQKNVYIEKQIADELRGLYDMTPSAVKKLVERMRTILNAEGKG